MVRRNTRELILATSLALFNELGEPHVTTNHIADEADISPGNLYYHFHSKREIVLELFKRFVVQLDPILQVPPELPLEAEDLWFQLHLSFELKGHYRFLYRNLADLTGRVPALDRAFRGLFQRERQATADMIASLERQGALKVGEAEKELLLNNLMLALIYWIPFAEVFEEEGGNNESGQVKAIAGVLQMILPYLREPEHSAFASLSAAYMAHSS
ncbi:MAG TPA: TetR/AcrR family transcriptional regulator [Xanthomonadales bacterium]|nr:TetR/AcrR family transcriptional regulator [Xanthomonadales bacterium]